MKQLEHRILHSPAEAERTAREFAKQLKGNECILCAGPMGIGKSVIIRAILRAIGATATNLPSPTFTLIESYTLDDAHVSCSEAFHIDLYRLLPDNNRIDTDKDSHSELEIAIESSLDEATFSNEEDVATSTPPTDTTAIMTRESLEAMALLELQDILESQKLVFIEWGDQLEELRPYAHYLLSLDFASNPGSIDPRSDQGFQEAHTIKWHLKQLTPTSHAQAHPSVQFNS